MSARSYAELPAGESSPQSIHILLVEDNKVNQQVALAILRKEGYHIIAVDNGLEAVERVKKEKFNAILMDCQMPVMDGFEATRAIRKMGGPESATPIIAITAYAMMHDREKCLKSGMDDYLPKPISRIKLIDIVQKYTNGTN